MSLVQIIGIFLLAVGLLFLYLEVSGRKVTESEYLGISGPMGLVLIPIGAVMIILG